MFIMSKSLPFYVSTSFVGLFCCPPLPFYSFCPTPFPTLHIQQFIMHPRRVFYKARNVFTFFIMKEFPLVFQLSLPLYVLQLKMISLWFLYFSLIYLINYLLNFVKLLCKFLPIVTYKVLLYLSIVCTFICAGQLFFFFLSFFIVIEVSSLYCNKVWRYMSSFLFIKCKIS